jgi:hypothetical protein
VGGGARVFWTAAIPDSDISVQFGAGKAEMNVQNLALRDYFNVPNALGPIATTAFDPARVSFDVVWSGPITRRLSFTDSTDADKFTGNYVENQVTVTWSGKNLTTGFAFTSNPGTFATSSVDGGFAELGQEQNGSFFSGTTPSIRRAQDGAVLTQVLASLPASPASAATTFVAPPPHAAGSAMIVTDNPPALQHVPGLVSAGVGTAHVQAIDQVFTDLDGDALAGIL